MCKKIKKFAFFNCKKLIDINLPICKKIGYGGFSETGITKIDLPMCKKIGKFAFYRCKNLISVNLPTCEEIEYSGFKATGIIKIDLPMCKQIGDSAFSNCENLAIINLPACEEIELLAFAETKITKLNLPKCKKLKNFYRGYKQPLKGLKELVINEDCEFDADVFTLLPTECVIYNQNKTKVYDRRDEKWIML